jgi:secreted Zn-dependent insulinase-like peptidase
MKLVICSNTELDTLEKWTRELFEPIENREI